MTNDQEELSRILSILSPGKRLKYIRQRILKKNQMEFCEDGIIRTGTLKSIETGRMKIAEKIAERIIHKLSLEGIVCDKSLFIKDDDSCLISINNTKKDLAGSSTRTLEEIRKKITTLIPIEVPHNDFYPIIPSGSMLLTHELLIGDLKNLSNTLCIIKGDKTSLHFLTYHSNQKIIAEINGEKKILVKDITDFCTIYIVELIYFGNKP
jgi:hypothetical protein